MVHAWYHAVRTVLAVLDGGGDRLASLPEPPNPKKQVERDRVEIVRVRV